MSVFARYMGAIGTYVNSVLGTGNITVTTTAGVATVDGSALAKKDLSNLTNPTAVSQNLHMAGATGSADLLWNTPSGGSIGVGYSQNSGTDVRPQNLYVSRAAIVGNYLGANPPYGTNGALVTGMVLAGNQSGVGCIMGSAQFWNNVAMGHFAFQKDGGGTNCVAFINLDNSSDQDVYFSLLHRVSPRVDYLKFSSSGMTFMQPSAASLLWNTDGGTGNRIGGLNNTGRPLAILTSSYGNFGNIPLLGTQAESYYAGYINVGNTTADAAGDVYAYMGSQSNSSVSPQIGFAHSDLNAGSSDRFAYFEWMYPSTSGYVNLGDVQWNSSLFGPSLILRGAGNIEVLKDLRITGNLGVGNSAAATGPVGAVTHKIEVFDASGNSLGFVPVYDSIT